MNGIIGGRKRQYNIVSQEKINKMMELQYEAGTESKVKWAVKNYNDWRDMYLDASDDIEDFILKSDLREVAMLDQDQFELALCKFICEVKKSREEGDYPGCTLYQMATAIQNYLKKKGEELETSAW